MARQEALLKLNKTLVARRNELRKRLGVDITDLEADSFGDAAETALHAEGVEMAGQLAQLEAKELGQVERAITRLKNGKYGSCEGCGCKIPVARLNILPTADLCVGCQAEAEKDSDWLVDRKLARWKEEFELAEVG